MIENIKNKIWDILQKKEVSLAMIFNQEGEILWHKGREIKESKVSDNSAAGFSKSAIKEILKDNKFLIRDSVPVYSRQNNNLPQSAKNLLVQCLLIIPCNRFYLYIDSGSKKTFSEIEIGELKVSGELLGEMIGHMRNESRNCFGLVGNSSAIEYVREQIIKYAILDEAVLLSGETGVGKSLVAELIHRYSGLTGKFVTVHTPSISENLFESEIFGHRKGAYTDAKENKSGLVAEAENGVLFLDEISEIPFSFQVKLLRFIETKKYRILGAPEEKIANVRIITATNRDLNKLVKEKKFREDLYYRLQVLEIHISPLRQRKEDIKPLVLNLIKHLKGKQIGAGFFEELNRYEWLGNVRDLKNLMIKAGIHCNDPISGDEIRALLLQNKNKSAYVEDESRSNKIVAELKAGKSFWDVIYKPFCNHDLTREDVRNVINFYLSETDGKYSKILGKLNIPKKDHKKFLNFLLNNNIK